LDHQHCTPTADPDFNEEHASILGRLAVIVGTSNLHHIAVEIRFQNLYHYEFEGEARYIRAIFDYINTHTPPGLQVNPAIAHLFANDVVNFYHQPSHTDVPFVVKGLTFFPHPQEILNAFVDQLPGDKLDKLPVNTALTGIKLLPTKDALVFIDKDVAKFVRYWSYFLLGEIARRIEPLRNNKQAEAESLKANRVEIQFPLGINTIPAAIGFVNKLAEGHFKGTYHSKIQRVMLEKNLPPLRKICFSDEIS